MTRYRQNAVAGALAFAAIVSTIPASACSPRWQPYFPDNRDKHDLVVYSKNATVKLSRYEETSKDGIVMAGSLHLPAVKCFYRPKDFGKCPSEMVIDFEAIEDGVSCPHVLSAVSQGYPMDLHWFVLSPKLGGGWFVDRAAKQRSGL